MDFTRKSKSVNGRTLSKFVEGQGTWTKIEKIERLIRELPVLLLWLVANATGTVLAPGVADRLWPETGSQTNSIFYIAFGVVVSLSGLCFRMSSSIEDSKQHRDRMAFAGERFLHSSFQFLTGAIFKYVAGMTSLMQWQLHPDVTRLIHFTLSLTERINWFPDFSWFPSHIHLILATDVTSSIAFFFDCVAVLMYWSAVRIAYAGVRVTHSIVWERSYRT